MTKTIARAALDEWRSLSAQAADLQRQRKTITDRIGQLEDSFRDVLECTGKQSITRHGFTLSWVPGTGSVSWAKEFLELAGTERVQELKDAAAAGARPNLVISAPE